MIPYPPDEGARLDTLERYWVLDTPAEPVFDRLAELAALMFEAPIAIVGFIDAKRHWFKGTHGVSLKENSRENAFCAHTILSDEVICVGDASLDERFKNIPPVTHFGIRYYAGAPLVSPDGFRIGTVCIFDFKPRDLLGPEEQHKLNDLAQLVMAELEYRRIKPTTPDPGVATMVERFMRTSPSPEHRAALEVASLVRLTDQAILKELVPTGDAPALLEWLTSLSFVQPDEHGVFPHDAVRQVMHKSLAEQLERYLQLYSAAKQFYAARIELSGATARQRWLLDDLFLHRHHIGQPNLAGSA